MSEMSSVPTFLRVKRRRNAGTTVSLRLEGLRTTTNKRGSSAQAEAAEALSDLCLDGVTTTKRRAAVPDRPPLLPKAAVWRRVSSQETLNKKRNMRVLDAVLEDEELQPRSSKKARRRLTLVEGGQRSASEASLSASRSRVASSRGGAGYKVLNPVERLVDDSLKQVFSGETTVGRHFEFVTTDPRLADCSRRWLSWSNLESGNLLHACALWNDVEIANELLSRHLECVARALDGDGRTPYQVAEMSGHSHVCLVMDAFGYDDDDASYVIDLYYLEDDNLGGSTGDDDDMMIACELQGGVGYWDDDGHLVLHQDAPNGMAMYGGDDEDADNDDHDSNHEDYGGNDYPEDGMYSDDSEDDDSSYEQGYGDDSSGFRSFPVQSYTNGYVAAAESADTE